MLVMKKTGKFILALVLVFSVLSLAFGVSQVSAIESQSVETSKEEKSGLEECGCISPCNCGCGGDSEYCGCSVG